MKTLMFMNFFLLLNLNINLLLIMNYFYLNTLMTPLKQLMYLISYIIFMSMNLLTLKQNISLNIYILMIIFISGILILFSYFISLINNSSKKNNYFKLIFFNMISMIIITMQMIQSKTYLNNLLSNYKNPKKMNNIKKLYLKPNYIILLMLIIFLMLMLMITTKICYIKNKNLRTKKWKK